MSTVLLRQESGLEYLSEAELAEWLREVVTGLKFNYSGELRYLIGILVGLWVWSLVPNLFGYSLERFRLRYLTVTALVAGLAMCLFWRFGPADAFQLSFSAELDKLIAKLEIGGTAEFETQATGFADSHTVDLNALVTGGTLADGLKWTAIVFLSLITLFFVGFFIDAVEGGRSKAWWTYLIATQLLAFRGHLPRQLMPFLDDAHRLGLLRAVGTAYQFRHADFQDYLSSTSCDRK